MSIRSILLLGRLMGMRQAAAPDHLAAVASMSAGVLAMGWRPTTT
jgi:hypothetical protein